MKDLVVIGHVMKEMIRFPDHTVGPVLGGPAAYSSVVAACLGARVGLVTRIGPDMPRELLLPLSQAGVDTTGMRMGSESRHALLIYDANSNKTMRYPKTGETVTIQDVPKEFVEASLTYVATLEGEVSLELVENLAGNASDLAVDLGGYGGAHCSQHAAGGQAGFLKRFLPHFRIAKASREDCSYLFPGKIYTDEELARILVDLGARVGVITCGQDGVVAATVEGEMVSVPAFSRNVVDCTGAGDAFSAGFLFRYQRENDVRESAIFATATSSLLIEKTGGITIERMPKLAEVQERVARFK